MLRERKLQRARVGSQRCRVVALRVGWQHSPIQTLPAELKAMQQEGSQTLAYSSAVASSPPYRPGQRISLSSLPAELQQDIVDALALDEVAADEDAQVPSVYCAAATVPPSETFGVRCDVPMHVRLAAD